MKNIYGKGPDLATALHQAKTLIPTGLAKAISQAPAPIRRRSLLAGAPLDMKGGSKLSKEATGF